MSRQSHLRVFYGGVLLPSICHATRRGPSIPNYRGGLPFSGSLSSPRGLPSGLPRRFSLRGGFCGANPIRKSNTRVRSRGRVSVSLSSSNGVPPSTTRIQSLRQFKLPISSSVLLLAISTSRGDFPGRARVLLPRGPRSTKGLCPSSLWCELLPFPFLLLRRT